MNKLKIAQVAPLFESVPPKLYGGTERVVYFLTEELIELGHEVTLFASGDSITRARLISPCGKSLRLNADCIDQIAPHITMLQQVQNELDNFDVVHYHVDYLHFPLSRMRPTTQITTLHGRLNIPELRSVYQTFADMPVVSISRAQRKPLHWANWVGNVYHGLPRNLFRPSFAEGRYLAFLGRISPEKGVDDAIDIAIRSGIPLKIAAKIEKADYKYYEHQIRKRLDHPLIEFIGEINELEKEKFLGNALALLFPINWPEPFGLVMIEAMACGTPVIAYRNGSVPEVIQHGRSGFIVDGIDEAVQAITKAIYLDRRECRRAFDERFTSRVMAMEYTAIYMRMLHVKRRGYDLKDSMYEFHRD